MKRLRIWVDKQGHVRSKGSGSVAMQIADIRKVQEYLQKQGECMCEVSYSILNGQWNKSMEDDGTVGLTD